MAPAEIVHRARYRAFLWRERRQHVRGALGHAGRLESALASGLRGPGWEQRLLASRAASARRYFLSVHQRDAMRQLMARHYAAELEEARREAARVRAHRIAFFGREFQYGDVFDWHADPVSWRAWPRSYHADVRAMSGQGGPGDIKYVWETNRHQFFVDLAKVAFLDGSAEGAAELHALHRSWMEAVPYGTGVPWASPLEPAFRVFAWLWSYYLLLNGGFMQADDHLRWLAGLHDHGHFLRRHLEHWSSPYNHLAGEASALYQLGVLFPEFEESGTWRRVGRAVLERSLRWQFHADGGSVEQSSFYHHATTGFYLLAFMLGRLNDEAFARPVQEAIERALEFSLHMRWPDGFTPSIGGGDDGRPIRMRHVPLWDFRDYLAVGAVLFDRPDFKFGAGQFGEDALWLLGPVGRERFEALPASTPPSRRLFRESGYAIVRSDWSPAADFVCFDCGPQAGGLRRDSVPSAAHGHADCLSVLVALGGRRVLVDPGFYCYNCPGGWEVHFRRTAVHNTVALDGRDQAQHVAKMDWCRTYEARWETAAIEGPLPHVAGSHDGFARGAPFRTHRRHVWGPGNGRVVLVDLLEGVGSCAFVVNFQFAPGELRQIGPRLLRFEQRFDLVWASNRPCAPRIDSGGPLPDGGWIAESLGVKRPAPRLRLVGETGTATTVLVAVLLDTQRVPDGAAQLVDLDEAVAEVGSPSDDPAGWLSRLFARWAS